MAIKKREENSKKIVFGRRRVGKHKKTKGPKEKNISPYRGQGR